MTIAADRRQRSTEVRKSMPNIVTRLRDPRSRKAAVRQALPFGVVGFAAFLVDVGVFNLMRLGLENTGGWLHSPVLAKIVSVSLATVAAWLGNRLWTFRHRRRDDAHRELAIFIVMCTIGLAIALSCLGISHYVLNYRSPLADNISANGIGLVLGTAFRFWAYRRFVFNQVAKKAGVHAPAEPASV
jgi:putative flippase GtrA